MTPADPGEARSLDELVERLRSLKVWAGNPSYQVITHRINALWTAAGRPASELARRGTVADCFKLGRRRVNTDLMIAVVEALHRDAGYVAQWRQALRVIGGEATAAAQVRAQDTLPEDMAEFTGRGPELGQLRELLRHGRHTGAAAVCAIQGMAGVGKTQLAVHAGHLLAAEERFEQVLFVDLRGFHPDRAQPPADPTAALESFLRLLGVPGQQIPHDLATRVASYRELMAGRRALVVLDNAASEEQVRPLLPDSPGCLTLVTSRRNLTDLRSAAHVSLDVFTPDEAIEFLKRSAPDVQVGDDPAALDRIAARCAYLPLALALLAGHIRGRPGWTLTDHADWLDERLHRQRLDTGVELALELSYQRLPADCGRLFRLVALHRGNDIDAYATAALAGVELDTATEHLDRLCADHLLRRATPGRYVFHDLVRSYAATRIREEDRPAERRAALTRLFDHYLYTAATAMDALYPATRHRRPRIPPPAARVPDLGDPVAALAWLDAERVNLAAVAGHAAASGSPAYTTRLATTLGRYLLAGGHFSAAVALHSRACDAARDMGDRAAEAQAINSVGCVYLMVDRYREAADHLEQARVLFGEVGDRDGEARALSNLGLVHWRLGGFQQAVDHHQQSLTLFRAIGDRYGEARALGNLGAVYRRSGGYRQAIDHHQRSLALFRAIGDREGEAAALEDLGLVFWRLGRFQQAEDHHRRALPIFRELHSRYGEASALDNLGAAYRQLGRYEEAEDHHRQALALCREIGDRKGEAWVLNNLGALYLRLSRHRQAEDHHRQALALSREIGERTGETAALNGLGETLRASGKPDQATDLHATALTLATETGDRYEQARAHDGLARAHHSADEPDEARRHWQHALDLFTELGVPGADQVRTDLAALDDTGLV